MLALTDIQSDALTEVVNIGVGRAASALSELMEERIELKIPHLEIVTLDQLSKNMDESSEPLDTSVAQDFSGGVSGRALLCFPKQSGIKLGQVLAGYEEETDELDMDLIGILEEVGNIVLNGVLGTIGNLIGSVVENQFEYSVPVLHADSRVTDLVADHAACHLQRGECSVLLYSKLFFLPVGNRNVFDQDQSEF